ncbi:alpha/beta-hydrolase [Microstroma glucosiphilum]|uniref:Alpha/beta-hydrolase n=1 Tax=Pseudomicrostroma glucosiphilum TaxID=1684307 RepID=A0A316UAX5_9BASI|nr:alpha/beta-hydrolase [Pseudomicrostroma glucosiphilum]PWN20195.1 alpha/beta-hydrolase [Pseudomicrostroma glucosiphilum]
MTTDFSSSSDHKPNIDDSLYSHFLEHGFKRQRVRVPQHKDDPTLDLSLHVIWREPSNESQTDTQISNLLLLHGHPQSALIWSRMAHLLPRNVRIIIPDLRGHGLSDAPPIERKDDGDYANEAMSQRYSKREMGRDVVEVVKALGAKEDGRWAIVGHDRGGRVAHRLGLDFPKLFTHIMLLDIAPTVDMYKKTGPDFAKAYWHWFFLIQPHPFPEEMILAKPTGYLQKMTSRFPSSSSSSSSSSTALHPPEILASYAATLSSPLHVQATCEDYRCSSMGGSDWIADETSAAQGQKVKARVRVLWGTRGVIEKLYGRQSVMQMWGEKCLNLDQEGSKALEGGHYLPEEVPDQLRKEIEDFMGL